MGETIEHTPVDLEKNARPQPLAAKKFLLQLPLKPRPYVPQRPHAKRKKKKKKKKKHQDINLLQFDPLSGKALPFPEMCVRRSHHNMEMAF